MCLDTDGGYFTFGGNNPAFHKGPTLSIPFTSEDHQYTVSLQAISIPSSPLITGFKDVILDSGTTVTLLPTDVFNTLMTHIAAFCKDHCHGYQRKYIPCFFISPDHLPDLIASLPPLSFQFSNGATFVWQPRHLFYYDPNDKSYCLVIRPYSGGRTILGAAFMRGHEFYFHRGNSTVFITEARCNRTEDTTLVQQFFHELIRPALKKEIRQNPNKETNDTGL